MTAGPFQARAAATGKARSPSVERRIDGTTSSRRGSRPEALTSAYVGDKMKGANSKQIEPNVTVYVYVNST